MSEELGKANKVVVVCCEILRGKGVTKGVRMEFDAHSDTELLDDVADTIGAEGTAALTDDDTIALNRRAMVQIVEEQASCLSGYWDRSFTVVFAVTHQDGSTTL